MSIRPIRWSPPRWTCAAAAVGVTGCLLAACGGGGGQPPGPDWQRIDASELAASPATPIVEAVAPARGGGWFLGGVTVGPDGGRQVDIWAGAGRSGPWRPASMMAVPGRDGPNETIFSIVGDADHLVAFGYRRSPTENYPRPSTWLSGGAGGRWQEILEDREFLGGPDVIGFGGLAAGPHGYTLSGTWTDARGRPTLAVWRSLDGSTWTRDSTDPAFDGNGIQIPMATGVADEATGILVTGTVETPIRSDPGRREGGMWFSPTGRSWTRLDLGPGAGVASGSTTFDAVTGVPGGWVVAGTVTVGGRDTAAVWFVDTGLHVSRAHLLPGTAARAARPVAVAAYAGTVIVAGADGDKPRVWAARTAPTGPTGWRTLRAPVAHTGFAITTGDLAAGPAGLVLVAAGADRSDQWWAAVGR